MKHINLADLGNGQVPQVPAFVGKLWEVSAIVCFEDQDHSQGTRLTLRGSIPCELEVWWQPVAEHERRFLRDEKRVTEHGAIGIASFIIHLETPYDVYSEYNPVEGGGFDYHLITKSAPLLTARLEVSGIRKSGNSNFRRRVRQELKQIARSDSSGQPGHVVVVEFGTPIAELRTK